MENHETHNLYWTKTLSITWNGNNTNNSLYILLNIRDLNYFWTEELDGTASPAGASKKKVIIGAKKESIIATTAIHTIIFLDFIYMF